MKVAVIQLFISLLLSQPANLCFFLWNQGGSHHKNTKQRSYWNRSTEKKNTRLLFPSNSLVSSLFIFFYPFTVKLCSTRSVLPISLFALPF